MNLQGHQVPEANHEKRDADVVNLLLIAVLLLLVIGTSLLVCWGFARLLTRERVRREPPRVRMAERAASFPQPQLLVEPGKELGRTRMEAQSRLATSGWVDRKGGVAHIPIRRAMELLAQRGLPEVGAGQTRLQLMQSRPQTNVQSAQPIISPAPEATP